MRMVVASIVAALAVTPALAEGPETRVSRERLEAALRALPTARSPVGDLEHQQGLARTEAWLVAQLKEMGHAPTLHPLRWNLRAQEESDRELAKAAAERGAGFEARALPPSTPELAGRTWNNIIVELPGRTRPREVLIVGAHFDAVPGSPGADDNGSGTAALLELARVLKDRPMQRTVRLMFFNLEEIGLKGAAQYVRENRGRWTRGEPEEGPGEELREARAEGRERIVGMLSLEMLGYYCDVPGCQKSPVPAIPGVFDPPERGTSIVLATTRRVRPFNERLEAAMIASAPGLEVFRFDFSPVAPPDVMRSDHAPFLAAGIEAVMVTDTANFRNPHYHEPTDTVETLDLERYTRTVRGLAGAVHAIAGPIKDGEDRPKP